MAVTQNYLQGQGIASAMNAKANFDTVVTYYNRYKPDRNNPYLIYRACSYFFLRFALNA
jgi:hypothetical protein